MENAGAIHQVETTVNFARRNRAVAWLLGGLHCRIEHHLFPRDLPRQLSGHLEVGGGDLSGPRGGIHRAQILLAGYGVAFPLAAADGNADHERLRDGAADRGDTHD